MSNVNEQAGFYFIMGIISPVMLGHSCERGYYFTRAFKMNPL